MKKYFDLRIKDAGGGETMTPQKEHFNKCINALHLELPQSVWNDVHFNWMKLREEIGKDKERIAELEKDNSEYEKDTKHLNDLLNYALKEKEELELKYESLLSDFNEIVITSDYYLNGDEASKEKLIRLTQKHLTP